MGSSAPRKTATRSGFFSVSRDIFDHPVVGRDPGFRAWMWMVSRACWKPTRFDVNGKTVTVNRGQFVTSYRQLSDDLGWSLGATQRFLTRLKTDTMIGTATDTGKMVITICNYDKYQLAPNGTDTPIGTATDTEPIQKRYTKEEGNKGNTKRKTDSTESASTCVDGKFSPRAEDSTHNRSTTTGNRLGIIQTWLKSLEGEQLKANEIDDLRRASKFCWGVDEQHGLHDQGPWAQRLAIDIDILLDEPGEQDAEPF